MALNGENGAELPRMQRFVKIPGRGTLPGWHAILSKALLQYRSVTQAPIPPLDFTVAFAACRVLSPAHPAPRRTTYFFVMKKLILLSSLAMLFPLFTACERQDWNDTKMLHDVPKKGGDKSTESKNEAEKPAAAKPVSEEGGAQKE